MRSLRTDSILAFFLVCTTLGRLTAQTPPPAHHPEQAVEDLGDQSYPVRALAEQRLRRLGRAAVPALERGLKHTDPEVRQRCATLLPQARRSDLDIELDAFLHNHRDAKLPPLPGWTRFQTMVGNDLSARSLYLQMYRPNKAVLELLEKDPDKVAALCLPRLQGLLQITELPLDKKELESRIHEFRLLMLAKLCEQREQTGLDNFVPGFFGTPLARAATVDDSSLRRLVARLFARQITSLVTAGEYAPHAEYLQLTELLQSHVKSLVEKKVDEAVKSKNINQIGVAVTVANDFDCLEMLEAKLKPAVLRMIEHVRAGDDYSELREAINLCRILQMPETLEKSVRPAVIRFIFNSADKIKSSVRIEWALTLANMVGENNLLDSVLRPAVIKLVAEAADNLKNQKLVQSAMEAANTLEMSEVLESLLLPAARRAILALLEQSNDWDSLSEAVTMSQKFHLKDMLDRNIKPVLCKFFQATNLDPSSGEEISRMLQLASKLQIKEVVPFALKTALAKQVAGIHRGEAILCVGKFGTREQVTQLEPLLKDADRLGKALINKQEVDVQLRDLALAVLLVDKGETLADYGFPVFQQHQDLTLYDFPNRMVRLAGFADHASRDAAFKKYTVFMAKQKK